MTPHFEDEKNKERLDVCAKKRKKDLWLAISISILILVLIAAIGIDATNGKPFD